MVDVSGHLRDYKNDLGFEDSAEPVSVNCCGYQKFITKDFYVNRPNGRFDYQIIYISSGKGYFTINETELTAEEGSLLLYRPYELQKYHYPCGSQTQAYWVHFTGYEVSSLLEGSQFPSVMRLSSSFYQEIETLYKRIMVELQLKRSGFVPLTNLLFRQMLLLMERNQKELLENRVSGNHLILPVIEYLHAHYGDKITVELLAAKCNLSTYRFIHNFKHFTGKSPIDYLINIRINKAKELLMDSSLSIAEIAEITGYENSLYFSRLFCKNAGMPPTSYRRQH